MCSQNNAKKVHEISKWAHDNKIIINVAKTKLMHINPTSRTNLYAPIYYNDMCKNNNISAEKIVIERVSSFKYLGVLVDDKLKWTEHIENVRKKLRQASFALYHLRNVSTQEITKQVYHAIAEQHIRYGITAWGQDPHCRHLQKSQNHLIKIIQKPNTLHNSSFKLKKILNVNEIYKSTMINTYYEHKEYRNKIEHKHDTRRKSQGRFKVSQFFNNFGKFTLPRSIPALFNELPTTLLNINVKHVRKRLLRDHFSHN